MARAAEAELDAGVRQAFAVQARAGAGGVEQVDGHLLEHAGADPAEHVVGRALLEDDGLDAGLGEQRREEQARRAGADDGDLGPHGVAPALTCAAAARSRQRAISSRSRSGVSLPRAARVVVDERGEFVEDRVDGLGERPRDEAGADRAAAVDACEAEVVGIGRRHPERQLVPRRDALLERYASPTGTKRSGAPPRRRAASMHASSTSGQPQARPSCGPVALKGPLASASTARTIQSARSRTSISWIGSSPLTSGTRISPPASARHGQ